MLGLSITLWYSIFSTMLSNPVFSGNGMLPRNISDADYKELKQDLWKQRDSLSRVFVGLTAPGSDASVPDTSAPAGSGPVASAAAEALAEVQAEFLEATRKIMQAHLENDLIPCWYGTEWDFNGISQVPGEGMIACGYFVSTLLRDLGFDLERYKLAQQASLNIVRSLSPKEHRKDWSGISTAVLTERIQEMDQGFYVVGLDNHVGFLLHDDDGSVWFIHSSYMDPVAVVRELATDSAPLAASNRYVIGYLESDWLIQKWLKKEKVVTIKS